MPIVGYRKSGTEDVRCLDHVDFCDGTPVYGTGVDCTYCPKTLPEDAPTGARTDTNVRNALFDPRCGWALISNGVYLGTSKVTGRALAMTALSQRERYYGLREPVASKNTPTPSRAEARDKLREGWRVIDRRDRTYDRINKERKG